MTRSILTDKLNQNQTKQIEQYLALIGKWNKAYNLTAIKDPREMVVLHIADSLSINPYLHGKRIIDVGTGAGLPGIPLAIVNPDKQFTLLDSNGKKTRFVTQAVLELGLENIEIIQERAANYQPEHCFDSVITRAFSSINDMLSATKHLCCKDGVFLAMKGAYPQDELDELLNGFEIKKIEKLAVPGLKAERHLVCIKNKL
jgi:16S rRNA (guanine527-N7)-methyltransferase